MPSYVNYSPAELEEANRRKALQNEALIQDQKVKALEAEIESKQIENNKNRYGGILPGTPEWYDKWNKTHRRSKLQTDLTNVESELQDMRRGPIPMGTTPFEVNWARSKGINVPDSIAQENPNFVPNAAYNTLEKRKEDILREMAGLSPRSTDTPALLIDKPGYGLLSYKGGNYKQVAKPPTTKKETRPALTMNEKKQYTNFSKKVSDYQENPPTDEEETQDYIDSLRGMNKLNRKNLTSSEKENDFLDWFMQWADELGIELDVFPEYEQALTKAYEDGVGLPGEDQITLNPTNGSSGMSDMPDAKNNKGRIIKDTETGKRYKSDGNKWNEVD